MARKKKVHSDVIIQQTLRDQASGPIIEIINTKYIRKHIFSRITRKGKLFYVTVETNGDVTVTYDKNVVVEGIKKTRQEAVLFQENLFRDVSKLLSNGGKYDFNKKSKMKADPVIGDLKTLEQNNSDGEKRWVVVELVDQKEGEDIWINYSEPLKSKAEADTLRQSIELEESGA